MSQEKTTSERLAFFSDAVFARSPISPLNERLCRRRQSVISRPASGGIAHMRSYLALTLFSTAALVSFWAPLVGFALVCCVLLIYLSPRLPNRFNDSEG